MNCTETCLRYARTPWGCSWSTGAPTLAAELRTCGTPPTAIRSRVFLSHPQGVSLLLAAVAVVVYALSLFAPVTPDSAPGPAYDLLFGVSTFDPSRKATVPLAPYVIDGTLYVQAEKLPANEDPGSSVVTLYHYHSQTGRAEQLPLLSGHELQHLTGKADFTVNATRHLTLSTNDTSPDGYSLAEPNWVEVDPIRNALGNLVLLLLSGKVETITKREDAPRLANQSGSVAIKSKTPLFAGEADTAFLLGWAGLYRPARRNPIMGSK